MKNILILFGFLSIFNSANSQTEKDNYKQVSTKFVSFFNESKNDSIVAMFSSEMNAALPIEKFTQVSAGLKLQLGFIKKIRFVRLQSASALYETTFDKAVLGMTITLNPKNEIASLLFKPYTEAKEIVRNTTKMKLPFKGEWSVTWGEVVLVVDGVKDNIPGVLNPIYIPGNTVIIKTATGEYAFFAHFKQHSIVVKQGQKVSTGALLGLCGNSGNSSEAHLHFHLQNVEDMTKATGVKCYFDQLKVNGVLKSDYSPVKGEKIEAGN